MQQQPKEPFQVYLEPFLVKQELCCTFALQEAKDLGSLHCIEAAGAFQS